MNKTTDGVPVSVCEFTMYVYVCVCIEVGAWVREHRPSGSGYDRLLLTFIHFCKTKHNKIVGVKRSAVYNVLS